MIWYGVCVCVCVVLHCFSSFLLLLVFPVFTIGDGWTRTRLGRQRIEMMMMMMGRGCWELN